MIKLNKNNDYIYEFTKKMKVCLYKELKKVIEKKKVVQPTYKDNDESDSNKKKIIVNNLDENDIECLKYLKSKIDLIIYSNLEEQRQIIKNIQNNEMCSDIAKEYKKNDTKPNIYKAVKYIFIDRGYESKISSANDGDIAYTLVNKLGINTCPYCNRNYISVITKDEKNDSKTRPQLDHFFPKTIYPFLACSFYNLIPSCSVCNLMKSDKDSYNDELISPYEIDNDTFKFSYSLNNLDIVNIGILNNHQYNYRESIKITFDKKNDINEKYFELEKLYNQEHRDIVIELLVKKAYYPESYINELSKFSFSKDEIYRYLFSNYSQEDDLHKRPLSKLIKDISLELGLT